MQKRTLSLVLDIFKINAMNKHSFNYRGTSTLSPKGWSLPSFELEKSKGDEIKLNGETILPISGIQKEGAFILIGRIFAFSEEDAVSKLEDHFRDKRLWKV